MFKDAEFLVRNLPWAHILACCRKFPQISFSFPDKAMHEYPPLFPDLYRIVLSSLVWNLDTVTSDRPTEKIAFCLTAQTHFGFWATPFCEWILHELTLLKVRHNWQNGRISYRDNSLIKKPAIIIFHSDILRFRSGGPVWKSLRFSHRHKIWPHEPIKIPLRR